MGDWVDSYLSDEEENLRRKMRLSDLAVRGAPILFRVLADQFESDIKKLEAAKRYGVQLECVPSNKFIVRSSSLKLPYARIDVELAGLDIVGRRTYKRDSTYSEEALPLLRFRICSDLSGNVYITNKGTPLDVSELSRDLLVPFLDYLRP